jgi:hypothetical protein
MQNFSSYRLESFVAGLHFKQESLVAWLNASKTDSSSERAIQRKQQRAVRLIEAIRERNALSDSGDKSREAKRCGYLLHLEILKLIKPIRRTMWKLVPSPELSDGLENLKGWYLEQHGGEGDDLRYMLGLVARPLWEVVLGLQPAKQTSHPELQEEIRASTTEDSRREARLEALHAETSADKEEAQLERENQAGTVAMTFR